MIYIIPIADETLDLIQVLNSGVRPTFQEEATCFLYRGENEPSDIITEDQAREMFPDAVATVTIGIRSK